MSMGTVPSHPGEPPSVIYVNVHAYQLLSLNGANPLKSSYGCAPTGRSRPKYLSSPVHHTSHRNRTFTTGIVSFTECQELCQVFYLGHSVKAIFAECPNSNTRQRHGPSAKLVFAECSDMPLGKDFLCRVSTSHTRQILARR